MTTPSKPKRQKPIGEAVWQSHTITTGGGKFIHGREPIPVTILARWNNYYMVRRADNPRACPRVLSGSEMTEIHCIL